MFYSILVHECDLPHNGHCSQSCVKKGEYFTCACNERYILSKDGKTCVEGKNMLVLITLLETK